MRHVRLELVGQSQHPYIILTTQCSIDYNSLAVSIELNWSSSSGMNKESRYAVCYAWTFAMLDIPVDITVHHEASLVTASLPITSSGNKTASCS